MTRFSLILGTLHRTQELERFLASLSKQAYLDFELILVDQNPDQRLRSILDSYWPRINLIHLTSKPGLSGARNLAFKYLSGEIVTFPDDDCWYPESLLEEVDLFFRENPQWDGLTGRSVDRNNLPSGGRWDEQAGSISPRNVWKRATSYSMFFRRQIINQVGNFDETLGVGAGTPWGSGEDIAYILRALTAGFRLYYSPQIQVFHPMPIRRYDRPGLEKAYDYGQGMGRVLRLYKYPLWFSGYHFLRPLGGLCLACLQGNLDKARYYWRSYQGRVRGWAAKEEDRNPTP